MGLKVRYSLRARQEQIDLLEYIIENFGEDKAKDIYLRIEKVLNEISELPEMYRISTIRNDLRKCVFSKQTSIYYRVTKDYVEVVSFRSNHQNPDEFKLDS